jgi:hypothetical protein
MKTYKNSSGVKLIKLFYRLFNLPADKKMSESLDERMHARKWGFGEGWCKGGQRS